MREMKLAKVENPAEKDHAKFQDRATFKALLREMRIQAKTTRYHKSSYNDYFTQIRYMLSIGYYANQMEMSDQIVFTGGLGVLGHLLSQYKLLDKCILEWRGTHDIDLILKNHDALSAVIYAFDECSDPKDSKSRSISNKLTLTAKCYDPATQNDLTATQIDACVPDTSKGNRLVLEAANIVIDESKWKQKKK